jgi:predicted hydrocarbon binding protein
MLEEKAPFGQKARRWLISLLPRGTRARLALEDLARDMSGAGGRVSVHLLDIDLYLIDRTSDVTFGRKSAEPICWTTVGLIQEALQRGSGMEYDIEETDCRAVGAEACKFRIRK